MTLVWSHTIRLHELARGPIDLHLEPDEAARARIAKALDLQALPRFSADVTVRPWLDGAEITGRFRAVVEQLCSLSLDPFEEPLQGDIDIRCVPAGSTSAPAEPEGELELDLDAPDPPDVLEGDTIDLGAYLVEHLALEIDPFPRKPGAEFTHAEPLEIISPFAALKALKEPKA